MHPYTIVHIGRTEYTKSAKIIIITQDSYAIYGDIWSSSASRRSVAETYLGDITYLGRNNKSNERTDRFICK